MVSAPADDCRFAPCGFWTAVSKPFGITSAIGADRETSNIAASVGPRYHHPREPSTLRLTPKEELAFQQFQQIDFWRSHAETPAGGDRSGDPSAGGEGGAVVIPNRWEMTRDLVLHDWQSRCVDNWFAAGKRGVIKVVTGAGKTILALAIIERLQQTAMSDLRVAIVVPTVVLLDQWHAEILKLSNLPKSAIGFIGAGQSDSFGADTRIIIAVLNSASKKLAQDVQDSGVSDRLLLIVDECHRDRRTRDAANL